MSAMSLYSHLIAMRPMPDHQAVTRPRAGLIGRLRRTRLVFLTFKLG